jgi:archaellum component FlaG (FlaF/FlaG flagellin family)
MSRSLQGVSKANSSESHGVPSTRRYFNIAGFAFGDQVLDTVVGGGDDTPLSRYIVEATGYRSAVGRDFRVFVSANTRPDETEFGANDTTLVSVPATTTGEFASSGTFGIGADDPIFGYVRLGAATGATSIAWSRVQWTHDPGPFQSFTYQRAQLLNTGASNAPAATTRYFAVAGNIAVRSDAADAATVVNWEGQWRGLEVAVSNNTGDYEIVVRSRVNGVLGNQEVVIPAGITGLFVSGGGIDDVAPGDVVDYVVVAGAGSGGARIRSATSIFVPVPRRSAQFWDLISVPQTSTDNFTGSSPRLIPVMGLARARSTELDSGTSIGAALRVPFATTLRHLRANVVSKSGANAVLTLRKNEADTAMTATITSTGLFQDAVNDVAVSEGDWINWRLVPAGNATVIVSSLVVGLQGALSYPGEVGGPGDICMVGVA